MASPTAASLADGSARPSTFSPTLAHAESPSPAPRDRTKRHQIRRSLTQIAPAGRLNLQSHHPHGHAHHHDLKQRQRWLDGHKRGVSQDVRGQIGGLRIGKDLKDHYTGRHSLDMSRANFDTKSGLFDRQEAEEQRAAEQRERDLQIAKRKADCRFDGLTSRLVELNGFSVETTKQLDATYYTLLEKLSALQATLVSVKELAEASQDIASSFDKDSRDLEHEIVSQIGSLGRFDQQQNHVEDLKTRIESGRDKVAGLSARVEAVRGMVEGWESADRAWQEKMRRKMKVIWSVVSICLLMVVMLVWARGSETVDMQGIGTTVTQSAAAGVEKVGSVKGRLMNPSRAVPDILKDRLGMMGYGDAQNAEGELDELQQRLERMKPEVDDAGLRAFDEL